MWYTDKISCWLTSKLRKWSWWCPPPNSKWPHQLLYGWWQHNEASNIWGSSSACSICALNSGYLVHNGPFRPFTNSKYKEPLRPLASKSTVSRRAKWEHQHTRIWWGKELTAREFHGFRNLQGLWVGYAGVGVRVVNFVPSPNPYPQGRGRGFGGFFPRVFHI